MSELKPVVVKPAVVKPAVVKPAVVHPVVVHPVVVEPVVVYPVVPWIRVRLRTAPGAAAALAVLVALTACLAAAFPRALDRYEDAGLVGAVARAHPDRTTVGLFAPPPGLQLPQRQREQALLPKTLRRQYAEVLGAVERPLAADLAQSSYGVRTATDLAVPDRWIPRPSGLPAHVALVAQNGLAAHASVRTGRLPRATGRVTAATAGVEAAVSAETARSLHIKAGSVIHVPGVGRPPRSSSASPPSSPRAIPAAPTGPPRPCCAPRPWCACPRRTPIRRRTGSAPCFFRPRRPPPCWARPETPGATGRWPPTPAPSTPTTWAA